MPNNNSKRLNPSFPIPLLPCKNLVGTIFGAHIRRNEINQLKSQTDFNAPRVKRTRASPAQLGKLSKRRATLAGRPGDCSLASPKQRLTTPSPVVGCQTVDDFTSRDHGQMGVRLLALWATDAQAVSTSVTGRRQPFVHYLFTIGSMNASDQAAYFAGDGGCECAIFQQTAGLLTWGRRALSHCENGSYIELSGGVEAGIRLADFMA